MWIKRNKSAVLIVLGALIVLALLGLQPILRTAYRMFFLQSYPWITFNLEVTGSDIESPDYLELVVEASDLRVHVVESKHQPKKYFRLKSSNGFQTGKDGKEPRPYIGEMYLVLSDSMVDNKGPSFRMELGKDILEWSYREYIYGNNYNHTVIFQSESPAKGVIFVKDLSLAKNTNKLKDRPDLDEYAFYKFEGTLEATFIADSLHEAESKKKATRTIKGEFKLRWEKDDRGS